MSTNEGVSARVKELQTAVADGVIVLEVRKRSARVQVLQANLDSERSAGDGVCASPGGATGMLVRGSRGKNAEQVIWKFDGALVAQINDTLKQARSPTRAATSSPSVLDDWK